MKFSVCTGRLVGALPQSDKGRVARHPLEDSRFACYYLAMKFLAVLLVLTCTAMSQTPDLKTMSGYPKMVQTQVTSWTTSAELASALRDAFAYCNRAYSALNDENAHDTVKAFGQERNRLGVLWFNASHNLEHYGNLVVYMRTKGIVPPSSEPKPQ